MWNECKDLQEYIVGLRRDLHQIPELGLHLPETAAYVTAELDKIGIPYICSKKDSGLLLLLKAESRERPSACAQIWMLFLSKKRQDFHLLPDMKVLCMPAAMIPIQLCC